MRQRNFLYVLMAVLLLNGFPVLGQQDERLPVMANKELQNTSPSASISNKSIPEKVSQESPAITLSSSSSFVSSNLLVNNNNGATGTGRFTQSETSVLAFGNNVVIGYNDAGSTSGGNHFTGWSYSSDGGSTFTDGGLLPATANGDAGDPVLARNITTGRIYFLTLGYTNGNVIPVFHSDDNGATWSAPVNGTPGGSVEDKPWVDVDNFPGPGQGNVYILSRRFGTGPGIYFFRSTDNGATFGPNGGTLIVPGNQGAYIVVGPDHSIYAFWRAGTQLQMRRSTDQGATFGAAVTVATLVAGGSNGDLGLTGIRQGTAASSSFRTSKFPHATVNPVTGNLYVTYANDPAGSDKADVFYVQSTDQGATWSAPIRINDDATTTDQWQPTVSVSPDGQRIGFFYYSRQEDPTDNNLYKYYGRTGTVSGATVTLDPSFAVSSVASLPEFGRDDVVNATYMGDYNTVSVTNTDFHVVWSDNRDDLAGGGDRKDPNVYYARVAMPVIDNQLPTITCPDNINSGNDAGLCSRVVNIPFPPASDNSGTVTVTGVRSDALPLNAAFPVGTTTITWTAKDPSNNSVSCEQTVTINDTEGPNAICRNVTITLASGSATITAADVNNGSTDNCGIQSITVSKTSFNCSNVGNNTVTLTVTDIHNNSNTCTATVTVIGEVPTCNIEAIPENNIYTGGIPTNIYLGYGPQRTTLKVTAPVSGAPYTYLWSGGILSSYNTNNPVFAPTAAGSYTFTVLLTNKYGCTGTCTITINVYDIRVPGTKGKKVYLCHAPEGNPANSHTLELNVNAVPTHLSEHSGDKLGSCDLMISPVAPKISINPFADILEEKSVSNKRSIGVATYPNPNNGSFNVQLNNYNPGRVEIRILSANGSVIERRSVISAGGSHLINFNLKGKASGMYTIQVVSKEGLNSSKFVISK